MVPFWGSFWIRIVFSLIIHSIIFISSWHLYSLRTSLSCPSGREFFFLPEFTYAIKVWHFPIHYFLKCCSELFQVYVHLRAIFKSLQFFIYIIYPFCLFVMYFLSSYFTPKLICFLCIRLLVCPRAFSPYLLVQFSFVIFESSVFVCIT